jgi:hypothetical protein
MNNPLTETGIHIVRLNTDKTRRTSGSTTVYQVYFELSDNPALGWRDIFAREWKSVNPEEEAIIDRKFLVVNCPISEIGSKYLPSLKVAVDASNVGFKQYSLNQAAEEKRKADVWKKERKIVEDVAGTLHFD